MATMFPLTMAPPPEPVFIDPYEAQREALRKKMGQLPAPMYSPEQIAERRATNQREYDLGLLGQLSGNEALGQVGGQIFKRALAQRDPRLSERGVTDQLSGQFQYSPDYLRQRDEHQMDLLEGKSSAERARFDASREAALERRFLANQSQGNQRFLLDERLRAAGGGGGLGAGPAPQVGVDPSGAPLFRMKTGQLFKYDETGQPALHTGPVLPKPSSQNASEDERKAAGWYGQAKLAYTNMQKALAADPTAAQQSAKELGLLALPKVGQVAAYAHMTPARQAFTTASSSFSEAVLRAATGAGVNHDEAIQKIQELTPRYGERPEVTSMKAEMMENYLQMLLVRAGRAAPGRPGMGQQPTVGAALPDMAPGAGAAADPLGLRGR